jgi:metal-responsive CopG/Arc/MetJ family transcriptional regulator
MAKHTGKLEAVALTDLIEAIDDTLGPGECRSEFIRHACRAEIQRRQKDALEAQKLEAELEALKAFKKRGKAS